MSGDRPTFLASFTRSQVSSLTATVVDFGTLVFLVEIGHIWYVAATALGALAGAITNFMLGRHWTFVAAEALVFGQALRYALVSSVSLVLNSGGVYMFTEQFGLRYTTSKVVTAILVGIFFNFPLHRRFVFRSHDYDQSTQIPEAATHN